MGVSIAIAVYLLGAFAIVALWRYGHYEGDDPEWGLCALVAVLWPLWLIGAAL